MIRVNLEQQRDSFPIGITVQEAQSEQDRLLSIREILCDIFKDGFQFSDLSLLR
jgi:hypothetical protein